MTPPIYALGFALISGLVLWLASLKIRDVTREDDAIPVRVN